MKNADYEASLEVRKIYETLPDPAAAGHGQIRVIDESGDDYLFPQEYFISITLPKTAERAVLRARSD